MNKDVLIIIPITNTLEDSFLSFLNELDKIALQTMLIDTKNFTNNLFPINIKNVELIKSNSDEWGSILNECNNYIIENRLNFKTFVLLNQTTYYNLDDIIYCIKENTKHKSSLIIGVRDLKLLSLNERIPDVFLKRLFNFLFNRHLKDVSSNICIIDIEVLKTLANSIKTPIYSNVGIIIASLENNIYLREANIKTIYATNKHNYKKRKEYFKTIKNLTPAILKSIVPYIINLLLFLIIFYFLNSSNDLQAIIISNISSGIISIVVHASLNYQIFYKSNHVFNNIISLLKKNLKLIIGSFFIYICYNLLNINLLFSKLLIDLSLSIVMYLIFRNVGEKNE